MGFLKILLKVFLGLLGVVSLAIAAVVVIWLHPELILTEARTHQLFDQYAAPFFSKKPEQIQVKLLPNGFNGKRVNLALSSFCLIPVDACFDKVDLQFDFKITRKLKLRIDSIGPVEILNQYFTYQNSPVKKPDEAKPSDEKPSFFNQYIEIRPGVNLKDIQIQFPKVAFIDQKEKTEGALSIVAAENNQLTLKANAKSTFGLRGIVDITTSLKRNELNPVSAKLDVKLDKRNVAGELKGQVNWDKLEGEIEGNLHADNILTWMKRIQINHLKLKRDTQTELSADLATEVYPDIQIQNPTSVLPKAKFSPKVSAKLKATSKNFETIEYEVQMNPYVDHGITVNLSTKGIYPFPVDKKDQFGLNEFHFELQIPEFQTLVQSLKNTSSAVPAPFSSMKGPTQLTVGNANGSISEAKLPVQLVTGLNSKEQVLKTESKGSVQFLSGKPSIKIEGETLIQSIRFTFPDLDILAPKPAFKNDSRIVSNQPAEVAKRLEAKKPTPASNEPSAVQFDWKIKTATSGIEVFYPVFVPNAPLEVEWTIGKQTQGEIRFLPFSIEYLNRKAKVTKLRAFLEPGDPVFHFEGTLVVPKTDYTIFIKIFDEDSKPKIVFSSNPPLVESDIISVLLFNQTAAELDPDQTSSVASTQAAVANRALGLFSIFALSSTPIEAVNYNPSSKVYSARVKLANGLTATVGTDWEKSQEVALRKRLGKNFVLSTIFQTDSDTNGETTKTLIEWFKRF